MEAINLEEYLTGILARWQPRLSRYHITHRLQVVQDTPRYTVIGAHWNKSSPT